MINSINRHFNLHCHTHVVFFFRLFIEAVTSIDIIKPLLFNIDFPGSSAGKESAYNAGNPGSIPGQEDQLEKG